MATITFNIKDKCTTHPSITKIVGGSLSTTLNPNKGVASVATSTNASLTDASRNISVQYTYNCGSDHGDQHVTITLNYRGASASHIYEYHCQEDCNTGFIEDISKGNPISLSWAWNEYGESKAKSSSGWKGSKVYEYVNNDCPNSFGITVSCTSSTHETFYLQGYGSLKNGPYNINGEDEITLMFYPYSSSNIPNNLTGTAKIFIKNTETLIGNISLSQEGAPGPEYNLILDPTSLLWKYGNKDSKKIIITSTKKYANGDTYSIVGEEPSIEIFNDSDNHWDYTNNLIQINDTTWEITITPKTIGDNYNGQDYSGSIKIKNIGTSAIAILKHEKQNIPNDVKITVKTNIDNIGIVKVQEDNNIANNASSSTTIGNYINVIGGNPYSISASALENYKFKQWDDNNTNLTRIGLTTTIDKTHTAIFEPDFNAVTYTFIVTPSSLTWDYGTNSQKSIKITSYFEFNAIKTGIEPTCSLTGTHWTKSTISSIGTNEWSINFTPNSLGDNSIEYTEIATISQKRNELGSTYDENINLIHKIPENEYAFSIDSSKIASWHADTSVIGEMIHTFKIRSSKGTSKVGWNNTIGNYDTSICTITLDNPNIITGEQIVRVTPINFGKPTTCNITLIQEESGNTIELIINIPEWISFINEA